jgi:CxxC motif-containing protein (DUF1111 family)
MSKCAAALAVSFGLLLTGCGTQDEVQTNTEGPPPGGDTTFDDRTGSAFENPAPNLNDQDFAHHLDGDVAFEATFVSAPAEVNPGLGPVFNNTACAACHVRNGRGLPVAGTGNQGSAALVRVSLASGTPDVPGGAVPVPGLGTQIQDHAIFGVTPEAKVVIEWIEEPGAFPSDGAPYSLRRPKVTILLAGGQLLPKEAMTSLRVPPPVFGLGLLEAVPEAALRALEDPNDTDGDGISGRLNEVYSVTAGGSRVGRFGWKSNQPDLLQQAAAAYVDDMGVTNPLFPEPGGGSDIDDRTLTEAAFYTQTLAVPRRGQIDDQVRRGEQLFIASKCGSCHTPTLTTEHHEISALANQTIYPYTDLLLHNMGFDLADGRPDFAASGTEWRTPPLWAIGLTARVLGDAAYLHDGRARDLVEAILWHGGEAESSKERFRQMAPSDRNALIRFLDSL